MKSTTRLAAVLASGIAMLGAAACGGGGEDGWAGTVTDSAGIELVQNPATGTWGEASSWQLVEDLRIGTAEGEAEYQFGLILPGGSLAVLSDGRIVVLDAQGQHLKVYAPDGTYERTIGRGGSGPGEIGNASQSSIMRLPGDTLQVNDFGNQRVSFYLADGTYVRSYPLDLTRGIPVRWDQGGSLMPLAQLRQIAFPGAPAPTDSMDAIVEARTDGTLGDTLMRIPTGRTFSFSGGAPEWNFFVPEPVWSIVGDNVLYGINDTYRIGVYNADGTLARIITKPFTQVPITDGEEETMREGFRKLVVAQGAPPQVAAQLARDRVRFHDFYPAYAQIFEGPDGTVMTQLFQPVSTLSEVEREAFDFQTGALGSRQWDVFDPAGRYLGVVEMPLRFQPILIEGNAIYGIQRDDLDVQYVVRLRVAAE